MRAVMTASVARSNRRRETAASPLPDPLVPNPEPLLTGRCHCDDDPRLEPAGRGGLEARCMPVAFETGRDCLGIGFAAFGRVGHAMERQPDRRHVLAFGALGEAGRPGLHLFGHVLAVRQHPAIVGFERDLFALDVLARRRRSRDPHARRTPP